MTPFWLIAACADWQAPQHCEDLLQAVCDQIEEKCVASIPSEDCVAAAEDAAPCEDAVDVSDTFDDCLADVEATDACLLDDSALPDSCQGAVLKND